MKGSAILMILKAGALLSQIIYLTGTGIAIMRKMVG